MLVNKIDNSFMSRSGKPNENWLNDDNYVVVPDGSELAAKVLQYAEVGFKLIFENDELIDIEPLSPVITQDEVNLDFDFRISCLELGV